MKKLEPTSVTRFGKNYHFGKMLKVFGNLLRVKIILGIALNLLHSKT